MDAHVHLPKSIGRLRKTSWQKIGAEESKDLTNMNGCIWELFPKYIFSFESRTYISKKTVFQQSPLY